MVPRTSDAKPPTASLVADVGRVVGGVDEPATRIRWVARVGPSSTPVVVLVQDGRCAVEVPALVRRTVLSGADA